MIQKIDHLVITTQNIEACIAFYTKLGFNARDAGGRYELFAGDFKINVHIRGKELEPHARHVQCGSADLCFEITGESLEDFKAVVEEQGIVIELGLVSRTGVRGSMKSFYLRDPDENLLEFCSYMV